MQQPEPISARPFIAAAVLFGTVTFMALALITWPQTHLWTALLAQLASAQDAVVETMRRFPMATLWACAFPGVFCSAMIVPFRAFVRSHGEKPSWRSWEGVNAMGSTAGLALLVFFWLPAWVERTPA